ncbi:hypothetical protein J8I29_17360, partial [Labrys sp. LIt4]|uniref:hypothetical protein n=1 Tax=Labrys sp. LIt4 TaxID=2821355 RepID=UPI001ADEC7A9
WPRSSARDRAPPTAKPLERDYFTGDHKAFLLSLRESGGRTWIIVEFLGDGYFGDEIPLRTLAKLVELGLDFGIEVFAVPQN